MFLHQRLGDHSRTRVLPVILAIALLVNFLAPTGILSSSPNPLLAIDNESTVIELRPLSRNNTEISRNNTETAPAESPRFTNIHAAGYISTTGELAVVGRNSGAWQGVDRAYIHDNLVLTLRAAYTNPLEWPGVTIDFGPQPGLLPVTYFGQTDNTHHGQVTFEADRLLKSYSLGTDNITRKVMTSTVPCYTSILDKLLELQRQDFQAGDLAPQRFFFEPAMVIKVTPDGAKMTLDQSKMILKWAYIPPDTPNQTPNATSAADSFVNCFNNHYDAFAAEQAAKGNTALYELQILGEIAALTKWIQDKELDSAHDKLSGIHYPWLDAYYDTRQTPATTMNSTPGITVSGVVTQGASVITLSIYGGVDLGTPNTYVTDPNAGLHVDQALLQRPNLTDIAWSCHVGITSASTSSPTDCTAGVHIHEFSLQLLDNSTFSQDLPTIWIEMNNLFKIVQDGKAYFGGYNNAGEKLTQRFIVPQTKEPLIAAANRMQSPLLRLTFDWGVGPVDPNPSEVDTLTVRLSNTTGSLDSVIYTLSNRTTPVGMWQTASVDLSTLLQPFSGQEIELSFEAKTDNKSATGFQIDNVFLDTNLMRQSNLCLPLSNVSIQGPAFGITNTRYAYIATVAEPVTNPLTYLWSPEPASGQSAHEVTYSWPMTGTQTISVTVQNGCSTKGASMNVGIIKPTPNPIYFYLPMIQRNAGMKSVFHLDQPASYVQPGRRTPNAQGSFLRFQVIQD